MRAQDARVQPGLKFALASPSDRSRTCDARSFNPPLYHLSYRGEKASLPLQQTQRSMLIAAQPQGLRKALPGKPVSLCGWCEGIRTPGHPIHNRTLNRRAPHHRSDMVCLVGFDMSRHEHGLGHCSRATRARQEKGDGQVVELGMEPGFEPGASTCEGGALPSELLS